MLRFLNDYQHGAHPQVMQHLQEINAQAFPGYGEDAICRCAADTIRAWEVLRDHPKVDPDRMAMIGNDLALLVDERRPGARLLWTLPQR